MKRAIISDIHSNLEALRAVLSDIDDQQVDDVFCLGDVVGYGPNPRECLDLVMGLSECLLGNHDQGALFDPEGFSSSAERAIFWTRSQLEMAPDGGTTGLGFQDERLRRWDFLCRRPRCVREDPYLFVHGSARNPLTEYVFPEDIYNRKKLDKIFALIPQYCFQGHTHVPGIFTAPGSFLRPSDVSCGYRLGREKVMINVGSVGQPRDGDPRACYVVVEDGIVRYRRVEYPVEQTIGKIHAVGQLDAFLGDRLRRGQ